MMGELEELAKKREELEKQISQFTTIETEKAKIADLKKKIKEYETQIHPSVFKKLVHGVEELGKGMEKILEKEKKFSEELRKREAQKALLAKQESSEKKSEAFF